MKSARTATRPARTQLALWTVVVGVFAVSAFVTVRASGSTLTLTEDQLHIINELESVLLHDSAVPRYDRVVNQFDTRGYVSGLADFSTAGGEALEVIQAYTARVGANRVFQEYLPTLRALASAGSDDTSGLDGYSRAWAEAASDPVFRRAQDDVLRSRYVEPATAIANDLGVHSPLGFAILYDSIIQHGNADGADGLPRLIERTTAAMRGNPTDVPERDWLAAFLTVRAETLTAPTDSGHALAWPDSVGRVRTLAELLANRQDDLAPPVVVNPYGTAHTLDLGSTEAAPGTDLRPPSSAPSAISPRPSSPASGPTGRPSTSTATQPPPPPTTTKPPVPSSRTLVGVESGKCLRADPRDGSPVLLWSCDTTAQQQWTISPDGTIRSGGLCMDAANASTANGTIVQLARCNGGTAQQFALNSLHEVVNSRSAKCVDVMDRGTADGTSIQLWTCAGSPNQKWNLR